MNSNWDGEMRLLLAITVILDLLSMSSSAQQSTTGSQLPQSSPPQRLEEITVTARKIGESAQNVPIAITAFSGAQLKQQSVRSLVDVMGQVPSLFLQAAVDDPQSLTISLRGRVQSDATLAVDASVGVYIDGIYLPRTLGLQGALIDLDRVEILRGPQGTLYGRNTTGGAISIFTKNPTQQLAGSVDVTGGNFGAWDVIAIANLPISDHSAARFVFERGANDGYGRNGAGQRLASEDGEYYRGKLSQIFGDSWKAVLSGHYEQNRSGGSIGKLVGLSPAAADGSLPEGGLVTLEVQAQTGLTIPQSVELLRNAIARAATNFYDNTGTNSNFSQIKKWDASLDISGELATDLEFRSITGVQGLRRLAAFGSPISIPFFADALTVRDTYYSQEVQILGTRPSFKWVAGVYAGQEDGEDDEVVTVVPTLNPGTATNAARIRNTSLAAFAQATWEFAPNVRLTGGVRYSYDAREAGTNAFTTDGAGAVTCVTPAVGVESTISGASMCPRRFRSAFSQPSWLASLDYKPWSNSLFYFKVSQGYRSGGQNIGGAVEAETFRPFSPETNIEYEAGTKADFMDHHLRMNLDGYYDSYSNLQVTTSFLAADGNTAAAVTNAASATIKGIELESTAVLGNGLTIRGSGTFTDARYGRFVDFTGDRSRQAFAVPKIMWSLSSRYETAIRGIGNLGGQVDYDWKDRTVLGPVAIDLNSVTQPSFGLLNARLNLHVDKWDADIAVFGKNLTSEHYYVQASVHDNGAFGVNYGFAGSPAVFGIEVIKKIGEH